MGEHTARALAPLAPGSSELAALIPTSMLRAGLVAACLACLSTSADARTYKWVDAQGDTHYTQTPPPESAQQGKQLSVRTGSEIRVRKKGKRYYCGSASLPQVSNKPAVAISNLQSQILSWQERIILTKESRDKYVKRNAKRATTSSFNEQLRNYDEKVAQRECQIKWAKEKLADLDGEKISIVKYHDELQSLQAQVVARKIATCGTDSRSGVIVVDGAYRQYQQCISPFDRELRKLRKRIRKAGKDAKLVSED